jgi:hypothetical protein
MDTRHPVLRVPLGDLTPHPRNAREGDVGAVTESIRAFGQYRPIVVQRALPDGTPRMVILAGNTTWRAARAAGMKDIDAVLVDTDDETALRIMLADNRTHDRGRDDDDRLADLLTELANAGTLAGTAWDRDDVDDLLRTTGRIANAATSFLTSYADPKPGIAPGSGLHPEGGRPTLDAPSAIAAGVDPGLFVTVAFTFAPADRDRVMAAVKSVQDRTPGMTQPAALLAIIEQWERIA